MGETRNAYRILVEKPEGRRRRWVENIKIDLREIEWEVMDWIDLAQNRSHWNTILNTAKNVKKLLFVRSSYTGSKSELQQVIDKNTGLFV